MLDAHQREAEEGEIDQLRRHDQQTPAAAPCGAWRR